MLHLQRKIVNALLDGVWNYSQSSTPRPRPSSLVLIVEIIGYPEQGDQI